jgi:hypothetical protein
MKLKPQQIKKLTRSVYEKLTQKKLIQILSTEKAVLDKIESIIMADAKKEEEIETLTKKMMEKFEPQVESGEIDYHKMYGMVKKQIMKEKKFTP